MELQSEEIKIERSEEFKEETFGIGDLSVVLGILRDKLYSDPIKALVQEVISNAKDANFEAGCADIPVRIHVPSSMELFFSVEDNGIGITPQRMSGIFIQYGASSKRQDVSQSGGFGIGAKSPFAYTDMFTIETTTIEAGQLKTRVYVAYIDETQVGKLTIVSENLNVKKTTGTKIEIQVKKEDVYSFSESIESVIKYFKVYPELNECEIVKIDPDYLYETEEVGISLHGENLILVNEIPYPINIRKFEVWADFEMLNRLSFVFKFGTEVKVAANREQLDYSTSSIELLRSKVNAILAKFLSHLQAKLDSQANFKEAVYYINKKDSRLRSIYNSGHFTYNGKKFQSFLSKVGGCSSYYDWYPVENESLLIDDLRHENKQAARVQQAKLLLKNTVDLSPKKILDVEGKFVEYHPNYIDWYLKNIEFIQNFPHYYLSSFEPFKKVKEVKPKVVSDLKTFGEGNKFVNVTPEQLAQNVRKITFDMSCGKAVLNGNELAKKELMELCVFVGRWNEYLTNTKLLPLFVTKQNAKKVPANSTKIEDLLVELDSLVKSNKKFVDMYSVRKCENSSLLHELRYNLNVDRGRFKKHPFFAGIAYFKNCLSDSHNFNWEHFTKYFTVKMDATIDERIKTEFEKIKIASYLQLDSIPMEMFEKIIKLA